LDVAHIGKVERRNKWSGIYCSVSVIKISYRRLAANSIPSLFNSFSQLMVLRMLLIELKYTQLKLQNECWSFSWGGISGIEYVILNGGWYLSVIAYESSDVSTNDYFYFRCE